MNNQTYREVENEGQRRLESAGVPDAAYDTRILMLHVSGSDAAHWPLLMSESIPEQTEKEFLKLIARREMREPLQKILGTAPFYGRDFFVDENVLIPRFDTETLIENVLPYLKSGMRIWDLCTGSGCILLTLLLEGPCSLSGLGTDLSPEAISAAGRNLEKYREDILKKNSHAVIAPGNLYDTSPGGLFCDMMEFDVIVSNPPYIPASEIDGLMPEVKEYEPHMALDGGADGMDFYRRILMGAPSFLKEGGLIALECGYNQTELLTELLIEKGFEDIHVFRDHGGNPRCVTGFRKTGETGDTKK